MINCQPNRRELIDFPDVNPYPRIKAAPGSGSPCLMHSPKQMTSAQDSIKAMIKSLHQRHLKGIGFRKTGNTWVRSAAWQQLINVQLSQWNSADEAKITMNLGISIEDLHKAAEGTPHKGTLKEYDCDIRSRIGELHADKSDKWWTVTAGSNPDELADDLFSSISAYGLPWFNRLSTYSALAGEFVVRGQRFMAALAYLLDDNRTEAERWMTEALANANSVALPKLERIAHSHSLRILGGQDGPSGERGASI